MNSISQSDDSCNFRTFLFLQGHPSKFWTELADGFVSDGHRVIKVNLCLADLIFWGWRRGKIFSRPFRDWGPWVEKLIVQDKITDIIYYADRFPYHIEALERARPLNVKVWVVEFGYLRPDWITLEPEGMGAFSTFAKSKDAVSVLAQGRDIPDMAVTYTHSFATEALHEVVFEMLQFFGRPIFPFYRSDKIYWPWSEYFSWLIEFSRKRRYRRQVTRIQNAIQQHDFVYNIAAMQLQADYQIRDSSPYSGQEVFLEAVIKSFAKHAPSTRHLVIKIHPLDSGIERWFERIEELSRAHSVVGRIHVIKGGDLENFLKNSKGVVLINSTVGIHALGLGIPTCALGSAVYDLHGLTHNSGLDTFWREPAEVDREYFAVFVRALSNIQIKGSFYCPKGRQAAVADIRRRFRGIDTPIQ